MNRTLPEGLVITPIQKTAEKLAWFLDKNNFFRHAKETARINFLDIASLVTIIAELV